MDGKANPLDRSVMSVARVCSKYLNWRSKKVNPGQFPNVKSFDMNMSNNKASAIMTFDDCPGLQALVVESAKMLTEFERAENFLELDLNSACEMHNDIRLTIQWADKKSPGRLVAELKEEMAGLKNGLEEVLECAEEWARDYGPTNGPWSSLENNLYNAITRWAQDGRPGKK